ncbi:MAG: hypothetical protein DMF84_00635 [Acidobacteria bacterium]|nr:MAG: hypothetical protein DMF84_00635 [Acidobacteriota bacterium]
MEFAGPGGLLGSVIDANMPTDERASLMELVKSVFEDHSFSLPTMDTTRKADGLRAFAVWGSCPKSA